MCLWDRKKRIRSGWSFSLLKCCLWTLRSFNSFSVVLCPGLRNSQIWSFSVIFNYGWFSTSSTDFFVSREFSSFSQSIRIKLRSFLCSEWNFLRFGSIYQRNYSTELEPSTTLTLPVHSGSYFSTSYSQFLKFQFPILVWDFSLRTEILDFPNWRKFWFFLDGPRRTIFINGLWTCANFLVISESLHLLLWWFQPTFFCYNHHKNLQPSHPHWPYQFIEINLCQPIETSLYLFSIN